MRMTGLHPNIMSLKVQPEIAGLRAVAILIVILGHTVQRASRFSINEIDSHSLLHAALPLFSAPAAGVYLFFSISGYLISGKLADRHYGPHTALSEFYWARLVRIVPPYAAILVVSYIAISSSGMHPPGVNLFDVEPKSLLESCAASLLFLHYPIFGTFPRLFPPGWTIEIEVSFYILAPVLWLGFERTARRLGLAWSIGLSLAGSWLLSVAILAFAPANLYYTILVYMPFFILGIALDHLRRSGWQPRSFMAAAAGWPALVLFVIFEPWAENQPIEMLCRLILVLMV